MESLEEIYVNARQIADPSDRQRYVAEACGNDSALRQRVEQMLNDASGAENYFGPQGTAVLEQSTPVIEGPGTTIGRYKLLQKIGEGGMGVVYMAEQREPVIRKVALKIIKLGMDTRQVVARFEAERQALALMDHPNIAKVFDGGTTDTGRPYFVMELVQGLPITQFCDDTSLPMVERLNLFVDVCSAVQHAHQKGLIHRDLKPSNILVTLHGDKPVPKVIDFGVAKATQGRLTDKTVFTQFQQFIGTPAYMSPEQTSLSGLDVDTRSDIYSLGVLLYELLTGKTPFDATELLQAGLDEMRQIIREHEAPKPSTRLSTMQGEDLTVAAKHRNTQPPKLIHQVRGDLDWIVMKCLEKDRTRRYESANGLAMDIQRHLANEPVVARPPSRLYEFQKTVRRHKFGFAAAAILVVVLGLGALVSTWEAVRATRAEQAQILLRHKEETARMRAEAGEKKAETEAVRSAQVARFMKDMLQGVGPGVARGNDTKLLREILDQTAQRLNGLKGQPEVEADLRATLGNVYRDLGLYTNAEAMLKGCVDLRQKVYGKEHPEVASALNDLAETYYRNDRVNEAEKLHRKALAIRKKIFGTNNADVATSLNNLGEVFRKKHRYTDAEAMFRETLAVRRKLFGNEHLDVAASLRNLGLLLWQAGKFSESESAQREALAIRRRLLGDLHPDVADSWDLLGKALGSQHKEEAAVCFEQALTMQKTLFGNDHPEVAFSLHNLGEWYLEQGNLPKAEEMFRQAVLMRRKVLGDDIYETTYSLKFLRSVLRQQGKFAEVIDTYREEIASERKTLKNGNPKLAESMLSLAKQLNEEGKMAEAEALTIEAVLLYRESAPHGSKTMLDRLARILATSTFAKVRDGHEAVNLAERAAAASDRTNSNFLETLAAAYAEDGKFTNAVLVEQEAIALAKNDGQAQDYTKHLKLYESGCPFRRFDEVTKWIGVLLHDERFVEAEAAAREHLMIEQIQYPDDWRTFEAKSLLGASLLGQKKYAEAEPLLLSACAGMNERRSGIPAEAIKRPREALECLIAVYEQTHRQEKVAEYKSKLADLQKPEK